MSARAAVAVALLAALALTRWRWPFDDTLITLAFSAEWAENGRPVWPGAGAVEGFSSPLWMAMLALALRLGFDGYLTAKALGFAIAAAHLVWLSKRFPADRSGTVLLLAIAVWAPMTSAAVFGMETALFAALLGLGWTGTLDPGRRDGPIWLGLAALTRPEGSLHALFGAVYAAREGRRGVAAATVAGLAAWHLTRLAVFGSLRSPPYLAKIASQWPDPDLLWQLGAELLLAAGVLAAAGLAWRPPAWGWAWAPLLIQFAVWVRADGDFGWARLLHPGLLATMVCGLPHARPRAAAPLWPPLWLGLLALAPAVLDHRPMWAGGVGWRRLSELSDPVHTLRAPLITPLEADVRWLIHHVPPGQAVWMTDVGLAGQVDGVWVIDGVGLTDLAVAQAAARGVPLDARLRTVVAERRPFAVRLVQYGNRSTLAPDPVWANAYPVVSEVEGRVYRATWYARQAYDAPPEVVEARWAKLCGRYPNLSVCTNP